MTQNNDHDALAPHEIGFLLAHCEKCRTSQVRNVDDAISHQAILRRDRAARQIELLDAMIGKLRHQLAHGRELGS